MLKLECLFAPKKPKVKILFRLFCCNRIYFVCFIFRPLEEGGKRIALITNTVALMHQQSQYLGRHVGLPCKGYSGDMGVDFWDETIWKKEINDHCVRIQFRSLEPSYEIV